MIQQIPTETAAEAMGAEISAPLQLDMPPAMATERLAVMNTTRASLGALAESIVPTAMALGTLGIMAYGIKTMFRPLKQPLSMHQ